MAKMNLESKVLRGVRVLNDVRMVLERNGSHLVVGEPKPISLSFARHLYQSDPQTETDAGTRWPTICFTQDGKATANRAGRLGSSAGVLDSRCTARFAAQAVPSGRQLVSGLGQGLAMFRSTGSLGGMLRPTMTGSLICSPNSSGVKNRIPPVRPQLQQPYYGNFTTY